MKKLCSVALTLLLASAALAAPSTFIGVSPPKPPAGYRWIQTGSVVGPQHQHIARWLLSKLPTPPKPAPRLVVTPPPPAPAKKPVVVPPPAPPKPAPKVAAVVTPPAYTVAPYPGNWYGSYSLRFGDYGTLSLHVTDAGVITGSGVCGDVAITATGNIDLASHISLMLTYANGRVLIIGPAVMWNGTQLVGGGTAQANDGSGGYGVRFILSHN